MEKLNLNIEVESEVANLYKAMDSNQQKKIDLLLGIWLKEAITNQNYLEDIMEKCSQEAQANGLTPEILESLLQES
ncbi:hypothetical protein [Crocosphaera sp. Alani8]|uniref:hypothetical protein n=1 Tax=Crocosphaera sp. Alani8 TaxID=3038952 RepID=UPI00313D6179